MTTPYTEIPTLTLEMMMGLSEAELKTLLVILRHTEGMDQNTVTLTYYQISYGTHGGDGRLLVRGTDLCHKSIARAVRLLSDKGYIVATPATHRKAERADVAHDRSGTLGIATYTYSLGQRMRPLREWAEPPLAKPVPEARYGVKTPRAA